MVQSPHRATRGEGHIPLRELGAMGVEVASNIDMPQLENCGHRLDLVPRTATIDFNLPIIIGITYTILCVRVVCVHVLCVHVYVCHVFVCVQVMDKKKCIKYAVQNCKRICANYPTTCKLRNTTQKQTTSDQNPTRVLK